MPVGFIRQREELMVDYILEPAIIRCVPLLDPARWESVVVTLWWTGTVSLALRLALVVVIHVDGKNKGLKEG